MRAATIGYYQNGLERLKEVAHATGICTHGHPTADPGCIGTAYVVKLILDGTEPDRLIDTTLEFTEGISKEFDTAILKVHQCLEWKGEKKVLSYLGEGWVAEEAVALALYFFLRYPDDYRATVLRGANANGDSDTIACMAGAFAGARLGSRGIPSGRIGRIEKSRTLGALATRLAAKMGSHSDGRPGERQERPIEPFLLGHSRERFLAGYYPGSEQGEQTRWKITALVRHGIRHVVNLMGEDEVNKNGRPKETCR